MRKPNTIELEVNAIREKLYEEIKDMSPSEMTEYIKAQVAPIMEKYGIHAVEKPPERERKLA